MAGTLNIWGRPCQGNRVLSRPGQPCLAGCHSLLFHVILSAAKNLKSWPATLFRLQVWPSVEDFRPFTSFSVTTRLRTRLPWEDQAGQSHTKRHSQCPPPSFPRPHRHSVAPHRHSVAPHRHSRESGNPNPCPSISSRRKARPPNRHSACPVPRYGGESRNPEITRRLIAVAQLIIAATGFSQQSK